MRFSKSSHQLNQRTYLYSGSLYNFAMAEYNTIIITILMKYATVIVLEDDLWEIARFVAHRHVHRRASVVSVEAR